VDAKGGVAIPGLINTHHHMFQNLARAYTPISNLPLLPWLMGHMPLWRTFTPEDLFVAAQVAMAELMLTGCTTTSDHHYVFPKGTTKILDAEFHAAESLGIRFTGCRGSLNVASELIPDWAIQSTDEIMEDSQRLFDKFHDAKPGSFAQLAVAPCTVFSATRDLWQETARFAAKNGIGMHTHCGETVPENERALQEFGKRPLTYLSELGWNSDRLWLAHGIHFNDDEVKHINRHKMGVAHCPCSNMRLGSGVCRVNDLRCGGSAVSLGVDGSASNDSGHMLNEVRQALLLTRVVHGAESITPEQALEMGTLDGARNLGRAQDLGSLEIGKCADVAVFPAVDLFSSGAENKVHSLVLCHARNVDTLLIHGKVRVKDGQIPGLDMAALIEKHEATAKRLVLTK
jgi:8-oxoguanine deaminase